MALTIGGKKNAINGNAIFNATNTLKPTAAISPGSGSGVAGISSGIAGIKGAVEGLKLGLSGLEGSPKLNTTTKPGGSGVTQKVINPYDAAARASAAKLAGLETAQPGAYQSGYQSQIDGLLNEILTTKKFNYNMDADPLYQQYKNQYMRQGSRAMRDTMGQATALTGGYGSSYASTAGNQAYQNHLGQLNDVAPQLYQTALNAYEARNNRLQNQLSALQSAENQNYNRWQDQYGRWLDDREYWYQKNKDDQTRRDNWKG